METKKIVSTKNNPAELDQSWHIPRPTLARHSKSSHGSLSSNNSTHSARSGSMLLTAANLAEIQAQELNDDDSTKPSTKQDNIRLYLEQNGHDNPLFSLNSENQLKKPDPDSVSVASSMHFTVVNVDTRPAVKRRSFCKRHRLTVLVVTMSALITMGIMTAILLMEMRARRQKN